MHVRVKRLRWWRLGSPWRLQKRRWLRESWLVFVEVEWEATVEVAIEEDGVVETRSERVLVVIGGFEIHFHGVVARNNVPELHIWRESVLRIANVSGHGDDFF